MKTLTRKRLELEKKIADGTYDAEQVVGQIIKNHLEKFIEPAGFFLTVEIAETIRMGGGGEKEYDQIHRAVRKKVREMMKGIC